MVPKVIAKTGQDLARNFMCICTLKPLVADTDAPAAIIVLSLLREVPFENGLVSCVYVPCVEACK